jgi:hypothetical protein
MDIRICVSPIPIPIPPNYNLQYNTFQIHVLARGLKVLLQTINNVLKLWVKEWIVIFNVKLQYAYYSAPPALLGSEKDRESFLKQNNNIFSVTSQSFHVQKAKV